MAWKKSSACVVMGLLCVALVNSPNAALGETLRYDDGSWYYRTWAQQHAAVRFTPVTQYYLESISAEMCYASSYGPKFPVTVTVWADAAGTRGSVLFSQEVSDWVGDPDTWNTFPIGIEVPEGESFWAGFTSNATNNSFGLFVDTSSPDYRSDWWRTNGSGWEPVEPSGDPGDLLLYATMVPEPATLSLLVIGALGLVARRRRK